MDRTSDANLEKQKSSHERVSVTAWRVAYRRTLSDIPFSVEIFDELQKIMRRTRSAAELQELDQIVQPDITPIFEARFKLVNRLLKEQNARQILEIAAGFSPRSLAMARDPSVEYSEMSAQWYNASSVSCSPPPAPRVWYRPAPRRCRSAGCWCAIQPASTHRQHSSAQTWMRRRQ